MKRKTAFIGLSSALASVCANAQGVVTEAVEITAQKTQIVAGAANLPHVNTLPNYWWIAPISSVLALIFAWFFYKKMLSAPEGNDKMKEIAGYVREGSMAYLFSQYRVV